MDFRIALSVVLTLLLPNTSALLSKEKRILSLEEIVPMRGEFFPERLEVQWISDHEYLFHDAGVVKKYDASTNEAVVIIDPVDSNNLKNYSLASFSNDGRYLLLTKNKERVFRHSVIAEYVVYDLENRVIRNVGQGPLQVVVWGVNGSLAYVQENNVYYIANVRWSQLISVLTSDGVPGEVYFGATDWIYEEEIFSAAEALWFSPKGTYLAVASFNDTNVESATYPYYGNPKDEYNQYPEIIQIKYPKAGRHNPVVGLRVFKLNDPDAEPWNIPAPVDVVGIDHVLGRVNWATDQNLVVLWLNRRQSVSILVNCDLVMDKCSIVNVHAESNGWIDITEPLFHSTGTKMVEIQPLFQGEQRFMHASRFNFANLTVEDLSPGNSTVTKILGWNEDTDTVYYVVAPGNVPWLRQIWSNSGGIVRCISCKEPTCRFATAEFSPGAKYGIVTCSACNIPPKIFLYDAASETFSLLNDNSRLSNKLQNYQLPLTLFNVLSLGEDIQANAKLLLPPGIKQGGKYPMIVRVYAGPGSSRVKDNFDLEYYNTYLTVNRSIIVASIDVRGSNVMGVEAMHAVNNALGTVEVLDTLETIRSLIRLYSFIDETRIGVWGWSYGGFATTMMLMQDNFNTITCGAAVAPVTNWYYYDSIYTERYMDTPQKNPLGYANADLPSQAEKLRNKKYLIVHGTGDDNVHFQNSLQLAKQLQRLDIEFEQMSYTDQDHSLLCVSRHFYHTLDRFWTECMKL